MNKTVIAIIVSLLLVINIWQWWPDEIKNTVIPMQNTGHLSVLTLPLPDYSRNSGLRVLTDPFYAEQPRAVSEQNKILVPVRNITAKKPENPFKGYELAGILYKNRRMSAFMIISGTSRIVVKGDIINSNVRVERITETSVTLRHTRDNKKHTIKLQ